MELLVTIIILALIFDYINGFHDAANSIATIVSTKVLTPFQAVLWAAFFNFVAFFIAKYIIGGFGIANTVSKTVVEQYITLPIILAGIIAAISWNLITWWKGIPSSSSHTLIGGFAGAAIMANGFEAIQLNIILRCAYRHVRNRRKKRYIKYSLMSFTITSYQSCSVNCKHNMKLLYTYIMKYLVICPL